MGLARAPGKVVLSGAYAVLEGAPAIVTAVDRYVLADSSRNASFETPEVEAAIGRRPAPWFDASALRAEGRKLGLGSSAAILVASLGALALDETNGDLDDASLGQIQATALAAHQVAQGGGSGIDVAASTRGGTLVARRQDGGLATRPAALPAGLCLEVWACSTAASTSGMVSKVRGLTADARGRYDEILASLTEAANRAVLALDQGDTAALVAALSAQGGALDRLGAEAGAPIFTREVRELAEAAADEDAVVMPAGAGGGDIAIFAAEHPPSTQLRRLAIDRGLRDLELGLEARGVHRATEPG